MASWFPFLTCSWLACAPVSLNPDGVRIVISWYDMYGQMRSESRQYWPHQARLKSVVLGSNSWYSKMRYLWSSNMICWKIRTTSPIQNLHFFQVKSQVTYKFTIWRCFHLGGYPNSWLVHNGKSHLEMHLGVAL